MTKIAVHLPTQEDFNKYMEYAKKKWRTLIEQGIIPKCSDWDSNICVPYGDNIYVSHMYNFKQQWYQILTLQEAIGQKKDEIIWKDREPKTGDWVMVSMWGNDTWNKRKYIATISDNSLWNHLCFREWEESNLYTEVTNWKLIKPYEDTPKQDWIDEVWREIDKEKHTYTENRKKILKEAILKHMPKQE